MYSRLGLDVDGVLELAEREVDDESGAEDATGVLNVDIVLETPAMDDDGVDDSSPVGEDVILDVVSRLEEVVEYDRNVESVAIGEDEIDDAVPEDISRAEDDQDNGTMTVEKVEKVVPIEPVSIDVGKDTLVDDDLVFETRVEIPRPADDEDPPSPKLDV